MEGMLRQSVLHPEPGIQMALVLVVVHMVSNVPDTRR